MTTSLRVIAVTTLLLIFPFAFLSAQDGNGDAPGIQTQPVKPPETDKTSKRIIALHWKARGGLGPWREVESIRLPGKKKEGQKDFKMTWLKQAPNRLRIESERDYLGWKYQTVFVVNGEEIWQQEISPESRNPSNVPGQLARRLRWNADFHTPLADYESDRHAFTYRGKGEIAGRPAFIIEGHLDYNFKVFYFFDTKTFQILNYRFTDYFAGQAMKVDCMPTGLKRVEGIWFETGYDFRVNGRSYRKVEIEYFELNPDLPEKAFVKPVPREIWLRGR